MKSLLIAEMKRAIELFEKIEVDQKEYERLIKEEEEKKKNTNNTYYWKYIPDTTTKSRAELKQILKMIRSHSITFEKQMKDGGRMI